MEDSGGERLALLVVGFEYGVWALVWSIWRTDSGEEGSPNEEMEWATNFELSLEGVCRAGLVDDTVEFLHENGGDAHVLA